MDLELICCKCPPHYSAGKSGFTTFVLEYVAVSIVDLAVEVITGGRVMKLRGQDVENVIFWLLKSSEMMTEVVLDKMTVNPEVGR